MCKMRAFASARPMRVFLSAGAHSICIEPSEWQRE